MTLCANRALFAVPCLSKWINTEWVKRSTPGLRLQTPLLNRSGNIGITVGEINAVSTPPRFSIQCAARLNVSSDIRNVHTEAPTATGFLNVNCIVEIARVVGIDGDDKLPAQIFASFELPSINSLRNGLCLVQNVPGKFHW